MEKISLILRTTIAFASLCVFISEPAKAQSAKEPLLFDLIGTERIIARDKTAPSVSIAGVREQEIDINFDNDFDAAHRLSFLLLDGMPYTALRRELEGFVRFAPDEFSWRGKISGDNNWSGDVILTVKGRALAGLIYTPSAVYEIVPQENFKHILVEIDQSQFPPCGGAVPAKSGLESVWDNTTAPRDPQVALDDGSQIDVMIVYTSDVRSALGGTTQAQAFAQQSIASTNTAYQNSGINPRLRLVNVMEVSYTEVGTTSAALNWVRTDATVAAARNASRADLVAILIENGGSNCGQAYVMQDVGPAFAGSAFSATVRSCAVMNLSFPHELGHNEGCEHDPENGAPPGEASYPYAFGHYVNGSFRTVMSYENPCPSGCTRVAHFSNPSITFNGFATGIANQRDNHRVINNTALVVSQFRDSGCTNTPITVGQTLDGTLTITDCRYPADSSWYSDPYTFSGSAGQQIAITMTSSAFDTWLALQDPNGTELIVDNNGGGGTNSRIPPGSGFYTLPSTGMYTIQASSNPTNATGSYSVSLQSGTSTWTDTDIAVGPDNQFRSLWRKTDGTVALWRVAANGGFQSTSYGPYSGWTAKAITAGSDDVMTVLWTHTNGSVSLFGVAANGGIQTNIYGPYAGWTAADIGVGSDNQRRVLWTNTNGSISVWVVAPNGSFQASVYGPYSGWTARRLAVGSDNQPRVLWTHSNGSVALWAIAANGSFQSFTYGPYSGWTGGDIGVGSDNRTRVLWTNANGSIASWIVQPNGTFQATSYGPYAGWTGRSITVGSDNQTRVLWNHTSGQASQWVIAPNGSVQSFVYGPY